MKSKSAKAVILASAYILSGISVFSQNIGLVDVRRSEQVITVGGPEADIPGFSSEAIQIALDAIKTRGGGTVRLNPGTFDIKGPVRLSDNISLSGSGKSTILRKCDGFRTSYVIDADWGMVKAVVKDAGGFNKGMGIQADLHLYCPPSYESINIVIPIGKKRFYYNRKINCLPVQGKVKYGDRVIEFNPKTCLGSLDWGRGVWEYKSYWNWASASGFLADQRTIGLNLGCGFGNLSLAGENAIILDNKIHKLGSVKFDYMSGDYMKPWKFYDSEGKLNLIFTPFIDRTATTNLGIITSEVHQMFGLYTGEVRIDSEGIIPIKDLVGFAEEHHAKW